MVATIPTLIGRLIMCGTRSQQQYADAPLVISCVTQYNCHEMGWTIEIARDEADSRAGCDWQENGANERRWVSHR